MVSERDREELRARLPELLALRLGVTDLRRPFRCPSPDHDDRDPSARYYEDGQTVHCFGCGRTWDAFSLVGELDGASGFAEQARGLAAAVGYRLEEGGGARGPRRPAARPRPPRPAFAEPRPAGAGDCGEACRDAFERLYRPEGDIGRRYLRWRGLDDGDAAAFGLGFASEPRSVMPQFRVCEPRALGFVTIPFWDDASCATASYCMLRTVCAPGAARCKEWRPAGVASPLWREWLLSCGAEEVHVVEGLIDAMALAKATGAATVALGGTAGARRMAQVVHAAPPALRPRRVVVCMDEDEAGRRARDAICADLDALGVPHAALPPYPGGAKDADEWLVAGRGTEWEFVREGGLWKTRWL